MPRYTINQRVFQLMGRAADDVRGNPEMSVMWTVTVSQAAEIFSVTRSYAHRTLAKLVKRGVLVKDSKFWDTGEADEYYLSDEFAERVRAIAYLDRAGTASGALRHGI